MTKKEFKQSTPGYFAVIPAPVLFAVNISDAQRILYAHISTLCEKNGYCWASNEYFAEVMSKGTDKKKEKGKTKMHAKYISALINDLKKKGFIDTAVDRQAGNIRKIVLEDLKKLRTEVQDTIHKNMDTYQEKTGKGYSEKSELPYQENSEDNNTSLNNTSVNSTEPSTHDRNIEFKNGIRDAEKRGSGYLKLWNDETGNSEIMNGEVKKVLFDLVKIDFETFAKRVQKYKEVIVLIREKNIEKYLYFKPWEYDFVMFNKKINQFYENNDPITIIKKLARSEETKTVERILSSKPAEIKEEPRKAPITEAEKMRISAAKEQLRAKMTTR